jgi:hypothetical protein
MGPEFCSCNLARSAAGSSPFRSRPSSPWIAKSSVYCFERGRLGVPPAASSRTCRSARLPTRVPPITHAQLIRDWRTTLDAFGEALGSERRYFRPVELRDLAQHLAADRRWLQHFAAIRNFP